MARPRKLIATKKIQGTYREDQEPIKDPVAIPDAPRMPRPPEKFARLMSKDALDYWASIEPDLQASGLFKMVDIATLVKFCRLSADIDKLQNDIDKHGWSYETGNGFRNERPEVKTFDRLMAIHKTLCREYGLTPLARDGIRKPDKDEMDDLQKMMQEQ